MIETSGPIDSAFNQGANLRRWALYDVKNSVPFIGAFDNACAVQRACVAWLATASRIESGAIECDRSPAADAFSDVDYARVEFDKVRISVIETFGWLHSRTINSLTGESVQGCRALH